jgi:hypothetical protein
VTLEEQHLFPVLRREAETKGLVAEAIRAKAEVSLCKRRDASCPNARHHVAGDG